MRNSQKKEDMKDLKVEVEKDDILDLVEDSVNRESIKNEILSDLTKLIFPICGKRCYNTVSHYRTTKEKKKRESEYTIAKCWETDGTIEKKCSMEVLIGWLTTEENCSSYFGGINAQGRTDSNRKETYHFHIRNLIKEENGKYIHLILYICIHSYI